MDPELEGVLKRFEAVPPETLTEEDRAKIAAIRHLTTTYVRALHGILPVGRYRSLALTDIESASQWAVKAVTHR